MEEIEVLVPVAEMGLGEIEMAKRPFDLSGNVIGFLWNSKPNGDLFLKNLEAPLREKCRLSEVVMKKKTLSSSGAPPELLDELSAKCDFVVVAIGD